MSIPLLSVWGMPVHAPYFPPPPARYRNVRQQLVHYRADANAVRRFLPDCFEPDPEGRCVAFGLSVPWCSAYGAFEETGLLARCSFEGQLGYLCLVAFLNSRSSIPAGRELYGTPKVWAEIEVGFDERVMYSHTHVGGGRALSIRSTFTGTLEPEQLPDAQPAWRLKAIPRVDGTGMDVLQLVDVSEVTQDPVYHVCRSGVGVVVMEAVPTGDLTALQPTQYDGAWYLEWDFSEGYGRVAHDFLQSSGQGR